VIECKSDWYTQEGKAGFWESEFQEFCFSRLVRNFWNTKGIPRGWNSPFTLAIFCHVQYRSNQ